MLRSRAVPDLGDLFLRLSDAKLERRSAARGKWHTFQPDEVLYERDVRGAPFT